jgi:hypothetical protein
MNKHISAAALAALAMLCLALPAQADTVLLDQVGLVSGRQSFVIPLTISGPGQLSVNLKDMGWLGALSDLSFSLSRSDGMLSANPAKLSATSAGSPAATGLTSFDISEAGTYYASISGRATGPYNLGLYGVQLSFASAVAPQVALPAAAWLLLSGLGAVMGLVRRRRDVTSSSNVAAT